MEITGEVLNSSQETRELVGKDGSKRMAKINHVLIMSKYPSGAVEIVNLRAYDASWELPKVGAKWTSPRVRRYENYDGNVADVMC